MTVRSIATGAEVWCVFDNTASGAAIENACHSASGSSRPKTGQLDTRTA
jgi:uncharacterized protein YecE (DUF72 family)